MKTILDIKKEAKEMSNKQKRMSELIDVMNTKIEQLENGYINDKNLEELTEKMNEKNVKFALV